MFKQEVMENLDKSFKELYHNKSVVSQYILSMMPNNKQFREYLNCHYAFMRHYINEAVVIDLPPLNVNNGIPVALQEYFSVAPNNKNQYHMEPMKVREQLCSSKPPFNTILYRCKMEGTIKELPESQLECKVPSYIYVLAIHPYGSSIPVVVPIVEHVENTKYFPLVVISMDSNGMLSATFDSLFSDKIISDILADYFIKADLVSNLPFPVVLWANRLLNCKNVSLVEVEPKPITKKQKKRRKNKKRESHYIIHVNHNKKISPPKKVAWDEKNDIVMSSVDVKMGHFKTYTKERPLLGKHVGTWWWSPILKDNAENKVTYKVEENV